MNTKKDIFRKPEVQNYKFSTLTNRQQIYDALTTQNKTSLCISKMSKLKKHSVANARS